MGTAVAECPTLATVGTAVTFGDVVVDWVGEFKGEVGIELGGEETKPGPEVDRGLTLLRVAFEIAVAASDFFAGLKTNPGITTELGGVVFRALGALPLEVATMAEVLAIGIEALGEATLKGATTGLGDKMLVVLAATMELGETSGVDDARTVAVAELAGFDKLGEPDAEGAELDTGVGNTGAVVMLLDVGMVRGDTVVALVGEPAESSAGTNPTALATGVLGTALTVGIAVVLGGAGFLSAGVKLGTTLAARFDGVLPEGKVLGL